MGGKIGENENLKKMRIWKKNWQKIWHNWEFGKLKVRKIWIGKIGKLEKKIENFDGLKIAQIENLYIRIEIGKRNWKLGEKMKIGKRLKIRKNWKIGRIENIASN